MVKNNYLSKKEQEIWEYIKDKDVVDNELIKLIFPEISKEFIRKILHNLYKKNYLKRAIKDVYYNPKLINYHKLALKIHEGYLGLTSALKQNNLIEYEDFTIFVMTKNYKKTINLNNYVIKYIPLKEFYSNPSLEKTFFDCFLKIKYLNYNILTKAIYEAKNIDWDLFLSYANKSKISLKQKIGYILTLLKNETNLQIPNLDILKKNIKFPIKLTINSKKTIFNQEWKIQDNIGKENILAWWYK